MLIDFINALNKNFNCNGADDLSGMDLQHYRFASSTNERGLNSIGEFEAYGLCMDGLRILDVGCAYGGFSIEAAKMGADCYGIEISPELYNLACLNTKDEQYINGNCKFVLTDAISTDFLEKMPHNYFDLIIVNDVFEHIYDTVQLLKNISAVANENCILYFTVPNGNDLRYVAKEGHTGYTGLSIIPPLDWQLLTGNERRNVYYRQYEYYQALFSLFGFDCIVPTNYPGYAEMTDTQIRIAEEYRKTRQTIAENEKYLPEAYVNCLNCELDRFDKQLKFDLNDFSAPDIIWKYLTLFWAGFAHRGTVDLKPLIETSKLKQNSDPTDEIKVDLSLKGSILRAVAKCDFPIDDYEFAFDLSRRFERIERNPYQKHPYYEWKLKSSGMYWVTVYIKHKDHELKDFRLFTYPLYYSGIE